MKIMKLLTKTLIISFMLFMLFFTIETKAESLFITTGIKIEKEIYAPVNRWGIQLTPEEIELLARIVQLECGYDIQESKCAAIETIFNRMFDSRYPNTLEEVLSQGGQFSTWKNRNIEQAIPTDDTYICINMVLTGQTNILEMDSVKFNNKPIGNSPRKIGLQYYGK